MKVKIFAAKYGAEFLYSETIGENKKETIERAVKYAGENLVAFYGNNQFAIEFNLRVIILPL